MAAVLLTTLLADVYRRLGDAGFFLSTSTPGITAKARAISQINESLRHHVDIAEQHDWFPLQTTAEIDVGADHATQVLTVTGSPSGGTFAIKLANVFTSALPKSASGNNIKDALRLIDPFTPDSVTNGVDASGSAGGPWTLTWPTTVDRKNIPPVTIDSRLLTGGTNPDVSVVATASGTVDVEYDMDHWLRSAAGDPNFRAQLRIAQIADTTYPIPLYWPNGGDMWTQRIGQSRSYYDNLQWPSEVDVEGNTIDFGAGRALGMYLEGTMIGFRSTPTFSKAAWMRAYYVPILTELDESTYVSLDAIGLSAFNRFRDLIGYHAAWVIAQVQGSPRQVGMLDTYSTHRDNFIAFCAEARGGAGVPNPLPNRMVI